LGRKLHNVKQNVALLCRYNFALGPAPHTAHWHGNTVLWRKRRADVVDVGPADMEIADMVADAKGLWMMHCHVDQHLDGGMIAEYRVVA
jgi:FtsP/CotA-like multicopper oxidase with cupredoxin domain